MTGCASGVAFGSSCYSFESEATDFATAQSTCTTQGQHLIYLDSNNEQAYIQQTLSHQFPGIDFWIGLTKDSSDVIMWLDQTEPVYTRWLTVSMSSFNEGAACFRMKRGRDYTWHDKDCESGYGYICERDMGSDVCPTEMVSHDGSCYRIISASVNYKEAFAACLDTWEARLVFIETEEEQEFLKSQIILVDNQADFWIGLLKSSMDVITWSDGTMPVYTNLEYDSFNEGTPCFRMKSGRDYYWHDRPCTFMVPYICEQEDACGTQDGLTPASIGDSTGESSTESSTESDETTEPTIEEGTRTTKPQAGEFRSSYVRAMAENLSLPDSVVLSRFRVNSIIRCAGLCNELTECTHFTHVISSSTCLLGYARNLQSAELVHFDGARSFAVSGS
ncbi:macrophage mannose receptor 1 [Strongylocentrotus purpuratus]|uniref:C-type lectin domain-containing protein n=1 Tax=Strongylocentrotus purpuratus TaxID=7668 RepID=A0A7M7N2B9_STRPU|nr:macrophage mannose receptor 1 [Strongylocentrotus purpuratus]